MMIFEGRTKGCYRMGRETEDGSALAGLENFLRAVTQGYAPS